MATHRTADSFEEAIQRHVERVRDRAEQAFQETIADAGKRAVEETPVASGRMAANWETVGANEDPDYDPNLREVDIADAVDANEIEASRAKLGERRDVANATPYGFHVDDREDLLRSVASDTRADLARRLKGQGAGS